MDDSAAPSWTRKLSSNSDYVDSLLKRLLDLRNQSDPSTGNATKAGKDSRAHDALETAGKLVEAVAGWAIHHTIGVAQDHLSPVTLQPAGTKDNPKYIDLRTRVDDHRHEEIGSRLNSEEQFRDPVRTRRTLIALLKGNSGGWPHALQQLMIEALEALFYGEQLPLLSAAKNNKKVGWRELQCQLQAISCVEYRCAKGLKKYVAIKEVAKAYNVEPDTVRTWEQRLRRELDNLAVSREIAFAKNRAANKTGDDFYGDDALAAYARRYWAVKRTEN
jgi:hypothetical protein